LPSVLTRRARWRRLWLRSAPVLAGVSTLVVSFAVVNWASGEATIDIDGDPSASEWVILAALAAMIPVALLVAWLVSRIVDAPRRTTIAVVSVVAAFLADLLGGSVGDKVHGLLDTALLIAVILVLAGLGLGSVLGWALRLTASNLASAGALVARALPVVLLTVLVFFNGYVWSMASKIGRDRMWLVVAFMALIAVAFLFGGVVERARPVLTATTSQDADPDRLTGTPFAAMPDPAAGRPLRRAERANVIFVVMASQITQIATVALVTSAIFFVLGLLVLSPQVLAAWTTNATAQGTWLGMTLPVPQALIHVTMFLGALTFMYVSARSVGDGEYRKEFLDPLVDDLRLTLVARNRYRAHVEEGR
jgi:MFS family permease